MSDDGLKALELSGGRRLWVLEDGIFITDAGHILGDTGGRRMKIRGAMHAVLIETENDLVLLDAGFGPEIPKKLADDYELRREKSLPEAISETGHSAEEVTKIILSHLDPDHVGWALNSDAFPNATVYVQADALEEAKGLKETDGRFLAVEPVERGIEEGWVKLQEGDGEVSDGIRTEVRTGHTEGHQIVWVTDEALYTADVAPSRIFLDPDLISGSDTDPEAARRNRIEILSEAEKKDAFVVLYHEPKEPLVKIKKSGEKFEANSVGP